MRSPGHRFAAFVLAFALAAGAACAGSVSAADDPVVAEKLGRLAARADSLALDAHAIDPDEPVALSRPGYGSLPEAQRRLEAILARREFRFAHRDPRVDSWSARILNAIADFIGRVLALLPAGAGVGSWLAWGFVVLTLVVLGVLLLRARGAGALARADDEPAAAAPGSGRWRARARAAAARGEYRDAVHLAYWAAAHRLDEREVLPFDPARTHREAVRRVPAREAALAPFRELVLRYERVWFGREAAGAEAWAEADRRLEELGCPPGA